MCCSRCSRRSINAETLGRAPEDIKMIWYCGGHGVCLTLTPEQLEDQENASAKTRSPGWIRL